MAPKRSRLAAILVAAAALAAIAAPTTAADEAMVRVLHASPDAPAVDIYVDGAKVGAPLADLEFGELSTYVALPAGTYAIKVCAVADASICPIDLAAVAVEAGKHYTIAATNALASIEAQLIVDAPSPKEDGTQVRVVHFSADTPAVDVLTQDGAATVVDALAYPNATGYLDLPAGSYDLKVCADADNSICPLDPGALDLAAGRSYSVFAIGSLTADPSTLTAVVGVDAVLPPATDTVPATNPSWAALLVAAGIASLLGAARLVTQRSSR